MRNNKPHRKSAPRGRPKANVTSKSEVRIWGLHACRAVFEKRPQDILKVRLTTARRREMKELLDWLVAERRGFEVVSDEEIEKITQSQHHEGVAMLALKKPELSPEELLKLKPGPRRFIYLHNVGNPHNFGAIARVAAFFGADGIFVAGGGAFTYGAAARVAEGGMEYVDVCAIEDQKEFFALLKEYKLTTIATTPHTRNSIFNSRIPERSVIMFGAEGAGLPELYVERADMSVSIPGTGAVESLNVACAVTAVLGVISSKVGGPPAVQR